MNERERRKQMMIDIFNRRKNRPMKVKEPVIEEVEMDQPVVESEPQHVTGWTDAEIDFVQRCIRTPSEILAAKIGKKVSDVDVLKMMLLTDAQRQSYWVDLDRRKAE